jgi:hypothetical protein
MGIITEKVNRHILMEADTSSATNTEMAICYHYNLQRSADGDEEKAKKISGIDDKNFAKLTPDLLEIGDKVARDMGNRGPMLIHSGAATASNNFYAGASDKTPKADFFGNSNNRISLKKQGDGGSGAQLMSAKSAEAAGVFTSSIAHLEANESQSLSNSKEFKSALDILEKKMLDSARNGMVVQAGKSKASFTEWYLTKSSRFQELSKKHPAKQVTDHLRAELMLLGVARMSKKSSEKVIAGVSLMDTKGLTKYQDEYQDNSDVSIGDVQVSAKHLKNVTADKLTADAVKAQVIDVVQQSVNGTAWKIELQKFFDNNDALKKWVVYEAGSGLFKFTGQTATKGDYNGSEESVANKILVFNDSGIAKEYRLFDYAMSNPQLCDDIGVTFKANGRDSYLAFRIQSHVEHDMPMLQEELNNIESELLQEGFFGDVAKKLKSFVEKAKKAIWKFISNIISKVIGNIRVLANKGIIAFNEAMGIDMNGTVKIKTPNW